MRPGKKERAERLQAAGAGDAIAARRLRTPKRGGYYRSVYSKLLPAGLPSKKWGNPDHRRNSGVTIWS